MCESNNTLYAAALVAGKPIVIYNAVQMQMFSHETGCRVSSCDQSWLEFVRFAKWCSVCWSDSDSLFVSARVWSFTLLTLVSGWCYVTFLQNTYLNLCLSVLVIKSLNLKCSQMLAFIKDELWITPVCACGITSGCCTVPPFLFGQHSNENPTNSHVNQFFHTPNRPLSSN